MFPPVYDEELRRIAHRHLRREATGRTLGTTELVHEAYLRLVDQTRVQWNDRAHFMAIAAIAMRRILVDRARSRGSLKRGSARIPVSLDSVDVSADDRADILVHSTRHSIDCGSSTNVRLASSSAGFSAA